jgi:predicted metal-binding membrane protein
VGIDTRAARQRRIATALRWRPEWRITTVTGGAWIAILISEAFAGHGHPGATSPPFAHHDYHHNEAGQTATGAAGSWPDVLNALPLWTLMSVAMMMPIALPAVRHIGLNSIRTRRQRAMLLYTAVYVAIWVGFGFFALGGEHLVRQTLSLDGRVLLAGTLALAAGWQLSRPKRRALNTCRRTVPLPPLGRKADSGCVRFALRHGWRCMTSCWALMLLMAVVGHVNLLWMVALTALISVEELTVLGRRLRRPSAAALALTAVAVVLGA